MIDKRQRKQLIKDKREFEVLPKTKKIKTVYPHQRAEYDVSNMYFLGGFNDE